MLEVTRLKAAVLEDLWKKVIETHVNEEKEEVIEEAKLEADPGTERQELLDYHPCAVAAGAGGIFGRMAGQSGQMAPENMLYSDWNDCMQGDINRDLVAAKAGIHDEHDDVLGATKFPKGPIWAPVLVIEWYILMSFLYKTNGHIILAPKKIQTDIEKSSPKRFLCKFIIVYPGLSTN